MAGGGQMDKVVVFGYESRGFNSSQDRSTSPLCGPLLSASPFLKNDVNSNFINKSSWRWEIMQRAFCTLVRSKKDLWSMQSLKWKTSTQPALRDLCGSSNKPPITMADNLSSYISILFSSSQITSHLEFSSTLVANLRDQNDFPTSMVSRGFESINPYCIIGPNWFAMASQEKRWIRKRTHKLPSMGQMPRLNFIQMLELDIRYT